MMLEAAVLSICMYGGSAGCSPATKQYMRFKQYDIMLERYKQRNPDTVKVLGVAFYLGVMYKERRFIIPTSRTKVSNFILETGDKFTISYRYEF